jgi:hypothetical protein
MAGSEAESGGDLSLAFHDGWLRCLEWVDAGPV